MTLPIVIVGITTITAGVLSLWLPETLNTTMHQTIEEAEAAPEIYAIPCRLNKDASVLQNTADSNDVQLA
jgi:hypothetical protein